MSEETKAAPAAPVTIESLKAREAELKAAILAFQKRPGGVRPVEKEYEKAIADLNEVQSKLG